MPVTQLDNFSKNIPLVQSIVFPSGRVTMIKVLRNKGSQEDLKENLSQESE